MAKDSVIKTVVRDVVKEEVKTAFSDFEVKMRQMFNEMASGLKNDLTNMKDEIVGEIQDFREENTILELKGQHQRLLNIDKKVDQLEKIHPDNKHSFATN